MKNEVKAGTCKVITHIGAPECAAPAPFVVYDWFDDEALALYRVCEKHGLELHEWGWNVKEWEEGVVCRRGGRLKTKSRVGSWPQVYKKVLLWC